MPSGYHDVDPGAIAHHYLKSTNTVIAQNGHTSIVGMGSTPRLAGSWRDHRGWGIVQHAQVVHERVASTNGSHPFEVVCRQAKRDSHASMGAQAGLDRCVEVGRPGLGKAGEIRQLIWAVPETGPDELFYQSAATPEFGGKIIVARLPLD